MPKHHCDAGDFSRMVCPEPCGTMHSYCSTCGSLQDECPNVGLALIPPQRCAPSEDEVANVLPAILVRVFEQDKDIVAQDAARAVLALFADQHTVAQVKAEALRETAVEFDREAAEDWMSTDRPATDDAATRWLRNYHGSIDSTALLLAFRAGQKAAQPDGESSWIGDHLRARAAAIESGADR